MNINKNMNQKNLLVRTSIIFEEMQETLRAKNSDYAKDNDAFYNFREFGKLGFLVRMSDKWSRLKGLIVTDKAPQVNETIRDTLLDMANYCVLLSVYLEEEDLNK